jgi:hypothetical protein
MMRRCVLPLAAAFLAWGAMLGLLSPVMFHGLNSLAVVLTPNSPAWTFSALAWTLQLLGSAVAFAVGGVVLGLTRPSDSTRLAVWFSLVLGLLAGLLTISAVHSEYARSGSPTPALAFLLVPGSLLVAVPPCLLVARRTARWRLRREQQPANG